jgi:hypothetical protein
VYLSLEPLVTVKSSETQIVDLKVGTNKVGTNHYLRHLTDKVETNHYLRHFEHRSSLHPINKTGSFRYMCDETSEGTQIQGYMSECVYHQETQRIRTVTNFFRRSAVPSEDIFSSSVTNVTDSRVLQTSHSPLKITGKRTFSVKDLDVLLGRDSAILVRNEITSWFSTTSPDVCGRG